MLAQIRLILLKEAVHLIAHVKYIFSPLKKITEHDDVFERGTHQFETVLNVFQCLACLLLYATYDFTFPGPLLIGSSTGTIFKGIPSGRSGKEKNIDVSFGSKPCRPVHLFLMIVRPERAPLIFDFLFFLQIDCLSVRGHVEPSYMWLNELISISFRSRGCLQIPCKLAERSAQSLRNFA